MNIIEYFKKKEIEQNKNPYAIAQMYVNGVDLKTFQTLLDHEHLYQRLNKSGPKVSKWGTPISPDALMAKMTIINTETHGLKNHESEELWNSFPDWITLDFLETTTQNNYTFHVKKIIKNKSIPVMITLINNPDYKVDPYSFITKLKEDLISQ